MEIDENGFDFEWDIKLSNGLNITENKLFEAMKKIGLNPEIQYQISQMKVDFAFPEEMIAIEVNGPYHYTEEGKLRDKKRYFVLRKEGWKVKTFTAKSVYYNPDEVAKRIATLLISNNLPTKNRNLFEEQERTAVANEMRGYEGYQTKSIFRNFFIFHGIGWLVIYILLNLLLYKLDGSTDFSKTILLSLVMYFFLASWWVERIRD
jgi:very-short-patch-repair endonuclease